MSRRRYGLVVLLLAVTTRGYSAEQTTDELLAKYDQTQKSMQTKYIKSETIREDRDSWAEKSDWFIDRSELYTDGSRIDLKLRNWRPIRDKDDRELPDFGHKHVIWDGDRWYECTEAEKVEHNRVFISTREKWKDEYLAIGYSGGKLEGFFPGDLKTVSSIFHEADQVLLYDEKENINGISCYVLETITAYGKHKIWLDPEHGYNICQAEVVKTKDDMFGGKPVSTPYPNWSKLRIKRPKGEPPLPTSPRVEIAFTIRNVKFQENNGIWVPMSADWEIKTTHENGRVMTQKFNHKRIEIDLSPDFEAAQAFVANIRNGTRVYIEEAPGSRYIWQADKPIPLFIEFLLLVGKPLPDLKNLDIDPSATDADDKMILVCFWDMEQRPSRYCIRQLAKQAEQLKQKGVTVVAVQVSKVDKNKLNEWVKEYNIPFTIGMIQGDEEKTKFNWGVKSLPWLILSDQQHIVRSEGFGIDELDERTTTLREE